MFPGNPVAWQENLVGNEAGLAKGGRQVPLSHLGSPKDYRDVQINKTEWWRWKVENPGFQRLQTSTTVRMMTKSLQDNTQSSHSLSTSCVLGIWLRTLGI